MKKNYTAVEMIVILPGCEDILTTSGITKTDYSLDLEDQASFADLFK